MNVASVAARIADKTTPIVTRQPDGHLSWSPISSLTNLTPPRATWLDPALAPMALLDIRRRTEWLSSTRESSPDGDLRLRLTLAANCDYRTLRVRLNAGYFALLPAVPAAVFRRANPDR